MKFGYRLFYFLFFFYVIVDLVYWYMGGEPVGVVAIGLSAGLALIIGYYFWFINSWWPLPVALSATAAGVGLIIGWWLTLIAVGALIISIMGFVLEYEKPGTSAHH